MEYDTPASRPPPSRALYSKFRHMVYSSIEYPPAPTPGGTPGYTINPFRTAVPFWGQTSQSLSSLSPKRDCGPQSVKHTFVKFSESSVREK